MTVSDLFYIQLLILWFKFYFFGYNILCAKFINSSLLKFVSTHISHAII